MNGSMLYPGDEEAPSTSQMSESDLSAAVRASVVNRTHRVVRERARVQSDRRSRLKSLWIPLAVCSALLIIMATGAWTTLEQYEVSPTGSLDSSEQMLVFLLWFFPISAAVLAMVWFKRTRTPSNHEPMR